MDSINIIKKKRGRKPKNDDINSLKKDEISNDDETTNFKIATVQSAALRIFFMSLNKYFDIITLEITNRGIIISEINSENNVLVYSCLSSDRFETYEINKEFLIHINLKLFCEIIKNIKNNDVLIFHNKTNNSWDINARNNEKNKDDNYTIKLINRPDYKKYNFTSQTFNFELSLPSNELKTLITKMKPIKSDSLIIKTTSNSISFICKNKDLSCESIFREMANSYEGLQVNRAYSEEDAVGSYSYKYFSLCNGFRDLCNIVHMYIRNDYPIVLEYDVASLGKIKICLSPLNTEKTDIHPFINQ